LKENNQAKLKQPTISYRWENNNSFRVSSNKPWNTIKKHLIFTKIWKERSQLTALPLSTALV